MSGTNAQLGFIGLGAMGQPMATTLQASGFSVLGYDLNSQALEQCAAQTGISAASSPGEVFERCDEIVCMLPTSAHLEGLLFGAQPVKLRPGQLLIDMSSGEPSVTQGIGVRLRAQGAAMVDAPVSGNVVRARKGDLAIMLGGEEADCERARKVLNPMARQIFRTGGLGSGQAMKALNNLASAAGFWIASEVLSIGKKLGIDPGVMVDVLNASTGANNSTQNKFRPFVLSGSYQAQFLLKLMVKDLGIAANLAAQAKAPTPLTEQVVQLWGQALEDLGPQADHTEVARLVSQRIGVDLRTQEEQS